MPNLSESILKWTNQPLNSNAAASNKKQIRSLIENIIEFKQNYESIRIDFELEEGDLKDLLWTCNVALLYFRKVT